MWGKRIEQGIEHAENNILSSIDNLTTFIMRDRSIEAAQSLLGLSDVLNDVLKKLGIQEAKKELENKKDKN